MYRGTRKSIGGWVYFVTSRRAQAGGVQSTVRRQIVSGVNGLWIRTGVNKLAHVNPCAEGLSDWIQEFGRVVCQAWK